LTYSEAASIIVKIVFLVLRVRRGGAEEREGERRERYRKRDAEGEREGGRRWREEREGGEGLSHFQR
jgi:hypothetical protein